jgi:hypothetical protein
MKNSLFSLEDVKRAPVGITCQYFSAPKDGRSEYLVENPSGRMMVGGSMPLHYFVKSKKPEGKH